MRKMYSHCKHRFTTLRGYRLLLLLVIFLFPFALQAQQYDTTKAIDEMVVDEEDSETIEVIEPPASSDQKNTFIPRSLQPNGGGPQNMEQRVMPDSVKNSLLKDEEFWYVNQVFKKEKKEKETQSSGSSDSFALTPIWIVVLILFVALIIWHLARNDIRFLRKKSKSAEERIEEDLLPENIFEINYPMEIQKAVRNRDYRLATRLYYLQLLLHLSNRHLINYKTDATNWDYLMQLSQSPYYRDFFRVTRHYEYAWYGKFEISDEQFNLIQQDMERVNKQFNQRA